MVSIKILESNREISTKINRSLAKEFDKSINKKLPIMRSKLKAIISTALWTSPEIQSLSGGILKADFGLTSDPSSAIVASIISTININTKKSSSSAIGIKGGIVVTLQPADYANLFSLSVAEQAIEGGSLPWLRWLLTLGDAIIIANFGIEYGPFGRTGKAHMTQTSRPFKVNSSFSGSADNNFITRAVQRSSAEIKKVIIGAI